MNDYSTCTVGIDLGDRKSMACVYRPGVVVEWFEFAMTPAGVVAAFEGKGFARVAMEAGAQSGWVTCELRKLGYEPVVANPRKLKAISANERKSDRNDAYLLAKLATADASLLYPIHHRSEEREIALSMLRARDGLVRARTRLICTVRALCKGVGARLKGGMVCKCCPTKRNAPWKLMRVGGTPARNAARDISTRTRLWARSNPKFPDEYRQASDYATRRSRRVARS